MGERKRIAKCNTHAKWTGIGGAAAGVFGGLIFVFVDYLSTTFTNVVDPVSGMGKMTSSWSTYYSHAVQGTLLGLAIAFSTIGVFLILWLLGVGTPSKSLS